MQILTFVNTKLEFNYGPLVEDFKNKAAILKTTVA